VIVHCPTCRADTILRDDRDSCSFCGTQIISRAPARTYGEGKRAARGPAQRCIREPLLVEAYELYQSGLTLRQVAAAILDRTTYASMKSCANGIHEAFRLRGWPLRSQRSVTIARNIERGTPRLPGETDRAYKLRVRQAREGRQPRCAATVRQPAGRRRGQPCLHQAMVGSDFCYAHNPERARQREELCARMRAAQC
jgi:hypothetical protein